MHFFLVGLLSLGISGMTQACDKSTDFESAKADLAQRLNVPVESVSVIEQVEKTWRDSSLGCAQPGMNYKQVLTPGSQLVLAVNGRKYHYHAGGRRDYFFCAQPTSAPDNSSVPESH